MTLKEWMDKNKVSVAELARAALVTREAVYCWLDGTRKPGLTSLLAIEKVTKGKVLARDFAPAAPVEVPDAK